MFPGTGGESIYGSNFPDESPRLKHDAPGLLSMAIADRDTLGSHFIITLKADHHLDRKNVVFGKLVEGLQVLKRIEDVGDNEGYPSVTVKIINCGEYNQDLSTSSKSRSITPKRRLSKSPSLSRSRPRPPRRNFSTSLVRVIGGSRSRSISRSPVRGRRGRNVSRSPVITRPLKSVSKSPIRSHRRRSSPRASSRKTISRSPVRVSRKNVSRSPVRSPARSLSKSSLNNTPNIACRYSNYRRYSPRRFRSPPSRGRTPPRYRRRSRTPFVSPSRRYCSSRSPVQ
ncbi:Cyclophilin peptidyl-prolyl cis-trans isomerase family protein [Trifolium repens]|nr:Cyclophilin peptidyl-prolyl cis-trans isomerase family protein [Trifolium repens]